MLVRIKKFENKLSGKITRKRLESQSKGLPNGRVNLLKFLENWDCCYVEIFSASIC